MWKKRIRLSAVLIIVAVLIGCSDVNMPEKQIISRTIDIDCSSAEMVDGYNSHSGLNGDGVSFYELHFADHTAIHQIRKNSQWHALPLPMEISVTIYGLEDDTYWFSPSLTNNDDYEHSLMPPVQNGYYRFIDRNSYPVEYDDLPITREYMNYTIAIYDTDADTLYYGECDI